MGVTAGKIRAVIVGGILLATAACTTQFRNHGYAPDELELANIVLGSDTRDTVQQIVGHPSAEGITDGGAWYYVESRFRHFAYRAPKEIEREVVVISFDASNRVSNIERFGLEDGQVIALSRRITDTTSVRIPLLRSLLGNLGQLGGSILG